MRLDYFYNTEGENFRFYQIPALLLEEEEYYYLGWHYPEKIAGSKKILDVYISHTI